MKHSPFWLDTIAKPAAAPSAIALPETVDVAIVGAGYTGLAAARRLAKSGASVVVLEREAVGFGASSRNGGQVLTGLKLEPSALVAAHGESRARQLYAAAGDSLDHLESLIADESIDCEYQRCGHIQAANKPSHFEGFREEQALLSRVFGHCVELVPRADQRTEIGSDAYHGLMVDARSGSLNPARYVGGLASAAARAGARIATGVAVERVTRRAGGWVLATPAGSIAADDVMFATNGYGGPASPPLQRRFVAVGSYIIVTEPLAPEQAGALLPRRRMAFDSKYFLHYFRLTADNRLLFGGRAAFTQPTDASAIRAAGILRQGMTSVFPELAATPIAYAWSGRVAFTRDQMPHAGRLDDGTYFAGGYCGHGVAMATALGDLVARKMIGEPVTHPLVDDRCPVIPLYYGTPWFLPLAGAYYRVKDWTS